jgi:hypothetical protein
MSEIMSGKKLKVLLYKADAACDMGDHDEAIRLYSEAISLGLPSMITKATATGQSQTAARQSRLTQIV